MYNWRPFDHVRSMIMWQPVIDHFKNLKYRENLNLSFKLEKMIHVTISHATTHIDVASSSLITWIRSRLSLMIRVKNEAQSAKIFNSERYNDILPNNCLKKTPISIRLGLFTFEIKHIDQFVPLSLIVLPISCHMLCW